MAIPLLALGGALAGSGLSAAPAQAADAELVFSVSPAKALRHAMASGSGGTAAVGEVVRFEGSVHWPVLRRLCDPDSARRASAFILEVSPTLSVTAVAERVGRVAVPADSLQWRGRVVQTTRLDRAGARSASPASGRVNLTAVGVCALQGSRSVTLAGSANVGMRGFRIVSRAGTTDVVEIDSSKAVSPA